MFSANLVATAAAVVVTAGLYVVAARLLFRRDLADTVVGTLCAAYVNAGNLGIPIAAYVLGNAALVAPTLLLQLLVLQPVALVVLDTATSEHPPTVRSILARPFRTPLIVGSLLGLLISVTGIELPQPVRDPLALVGGMAVPAMLISYGVFLRLGPRPGRGMAVGEVATVTVLKLVVQPLTAYVVARFALGLEGHALLSVAVLSALPTAQNVFIAASRYDRGVVLARDAVFATTVLSVPAVVVITALLG